ncbi:MAG: Hsp20/alpha crystallin family protein [Spirochaetales bacterium]|uniref:Hsp20/alpha crystallin family protein n=1 Tax=Candidatus Thalassospirochaeta sargassi TaxID=3119039 RepID=A0AAJ1MJD6_9SPIO|nr:Hsp20/alpha crystallin family protein [Spirochaetales bacterium]
MDRRKNIDTKKHNQVACCDIFNGEETVILKLEMPGVPKENLDISIDNDTLIISGKKLMPSEDGNYIIREIRNADYYQKYTLDDTIDRTNIDASVKNGVVTLILSLKESVKPRKIQIKEG